LLPKPYSRIYCRMKTTIDLPEEVLTRAKILAAERRTTLKELVLQGLKLVTETPTKADQEKREAELRTLLDAMRASNTEPMAPLKREEIYER